MIVVMMLWSVCPPPLPSVEEVVERARENLRKIDELQFRATYHEYGHDDLTTTCNEYRFQLQMDWTAESAKTSIFGGNGVELLAIYVDGTEVENHSTFTADDWCRFVGSHRHSWIGGYWFNTAPMTVDEVLGEGKLICHELSCFIEREVKSVEGDGQTYWIKFVYIVDRVDFFLQTWVTEKRRGNTWEEGQVQRVVVRNYYYDKVVKKAEEVDDVNVHRADVVDAVVRRGQ